MTATAAEKAKQLFDRFYEITPLTTSMNDTVEIANNKILKDLHLAKRCALIVVEEIDRAIDFDWMEVQNLDRVHKYWDDVKNEIHSIP